MRAGVAACAECTAVWAEAHRECHLWLCGSRILRENADGRAGRRHCPGENLLLPLADVLYRLAPLSTETWKYLLHFLLAASAGGVGSQAAEN